MKVGVPTEFLIVKGHLKRLRLQRSDLSLLPIASFAEVTQVTQNSGGFLISALEFLSRCGDCVYFKTPTTLTSMVILDPRLLVIRLDWRLRKH